MPIVFPNGFLKHVQLDFFRIFPFFLAKFPLPWPKVGEAFMIYCSTDRLEFFEYCTYELNNVMFLYLYTIFNNTVCILIFLMNVLVF